MERFFLLLILIVPVSLGTDLCAQGKQLLIEDLSYQNIVVQPAQGLIWKVSGNELSQPSFIYGVIHLAPRAQFFLPPILDSIIQEAEEIMMEIDPTREDNDYLFRSEVPIDSTLDVLLPRRDYKWLDEFIEKELSEESEKKLMRRYAPLVLLRQMMIDYCLFLGKGRTAVSYEAYIREATLEKDFTSLEMDWIRLAWLDSHSFQEQTHMLMESLESRVEQRAAYEGMIRAYRQQNLDRVWLLSHDSPDLGDNKHTLIDLKISNWKKALTEGMPDKSICAIVPAIALPGEYGLLHILRKAGYKVEALSY